MKHRYGNSNLNDFDSVWQQTSERKICLLWDAALPEAWLGEIKY